MDTLQRRIERLTRFEELLRAHPNPSDEQTAALIREACMVIERIIQDYPASRDTLAARLPQLFQLAGHNMN